MTYLPEIQWPKRRRRKRRQLGTLVVFREGVSRRQARAALAMIGPLLDPQTGFLPNSEGAVPFTDEYDYAPYVLHVFDAS